MDNFLARFRKSEDPVIRVLRNGGWLLSSKGVTAVLSFFYIAILARTLGPAGFGLFAMIMAMTRLLQALLRFTTWQLVVKFGMPYALDGDDRKFSAVAARCLRLELLGGLTAAVLIYFVMHFIGARNQWEPGLVDYASITAIIIMFCLRSTAQGILRVRDRFRDGALGDAITPIGRMVGALVVVLIGPRLEYFLIAWALAELASTFVYWFLVQRHAPLASSGMTSNSIREVSAETPGFWSFFFNTNLTSFVASMRENLVVIIIGFFVGAGPAGLFRLANQLANSVVRLTEIVSRPLFTELSRIYAGGDYAAFQSLFSRSLRMSAITGGAVILLLALIGKPLLILIAGREFVDAYPLLLLLGMATAAGLIGVGLDPVLQASGKPHISTAIHVAAIGITLAGLALFIKTGGVTAAASSVLAGALLTLLMALFFAIRLMRKMKRKAQR